MPKISQATAEARRTLILDAAARCFARRGINVSVDEICAEAKVSKGALYIYFPSKRDIIQGLADRQMHDLSPIVGAESLVALGDLLIAGRPGGDPKAARFELEAWTYSLDDEALRARLRANVADLRQAIAAALANLQGRGLVTLRATPEACAAVIEAFALGVVAQDALEARAHEQKTLMKLVLESLAQPRD